MADFKERLIRGSRWDAGYENPGYLGLVDRIHCKVRPRTYVEIGVRFGASLAIALPGTVRVGIDPEPEVRFPVDPRSHIFALSSDGFFSQHNLADALGGLPLDLAFIDGMHNFEFALRDFITSSGAPRRRLRSLCTIVIPSTRKCLQGSQHNCLERRHLEVDHLAVGSFGMPNLDLGQPHQTAVCGRAVPDSAPTGHLILPLGEHLVADLASR
jgi:hypothetical protein